MRTLLVVLTLLSPATLAAQSSAPPAAPPDAYADAGARVLVQRAREARGELGRSVTAYTAVVRSRSAALLRTPLKDRTLGRSESAARVRWSRDGAAVVQVLAAREQGPGGAGPGDGPDRSRIFDPSGDRVYFGMNLGAATDDDLWIAHPLADDAERYYRYRSGDTLALRLPGGRTIRSVELHVVPRTPSFHYLNATLWIEPESGAVVQAVYRPSRSLDLERDTAFIDADDLEALDRVPGAFKPFEVELESVVVQYSLWDQEHWLPRLMRVEGSARAGWLRLAFGEEISYAVEEVEDEESAGGAEPEPAAVLAGWGAPVSELEAQRERTGERGRRVQHVYLPRDREALLRGEQLPPPIWSASPEFASEGELEALVRQLESAIPRRATEMPVEYAVEWGLGGAGLLRYNRVEGLSVGVRGTATHSLGEAYATARLGTADLHPNVETGVRLPLRRRLVSAALYHELVGVEGQHGALGLGSSLGALLLGRDDGQYYRATGARLSVAPRPQDRQWYRWSAYAERQREAERHTEWSVARLLGADGFRPNLTAGEADLVGTALTLSPWWGRDPRGAQAGVELYGEAAAGDYRFTRARLTARTVIPLGGAYRAGLEAAGGSSWGSMPLQYHWFLGGPATLRGYPGDAAVGPSFVRARAELARATGFGALALFGDAGWAGERDAFDADDALLSAGAGVSVFDGLLRLDLARALRAPAEWRMDIYLDAMM